VHGMDDSGRAQRPAWVTMRESKMPASGNNSGAGYGGASVPGMNSGDNNKAKRS
jgi:hypothetical protein